MKPKLRMMTAMALLLLICLPACKYLKKIDLEKKELPH